MPLSYDDIERGRRREWEKLQNPDERKAREQEAREADPEHEKKMSGFDLRQKRRREARESDLVKWSKTKREAVILLGGVFIIVVAILGFQWAVGAAIRKSQQNKAAELRKVVGGGNAYASFNDPYEAWASWRSAWMRREATAVYNTYSQGLQKRERGQLSPEAYISLLQRQIRQGNKEHFFEIANAFSTPEVFLMPRGKPSAGDLAVFKTQQMKMKRMTVPQVWVLAIAWDDNLKQWRIEELSNDDAWTDSWKNAKQITRERRVAD